MTYNEEYDANIYRMLKVFDRFQHTVGEHYTDSRTVCIMFYCFQEEYAISRSDGYPELTDKGKAYLKQHEETHTDRHRY